MASRDPVGRTSSWKSFFSRFQRGLPGSERGRDAAGSGVPRIESLEVTEAVLEELCPDLNVQERVKTLCTLEDVVLNNRIPESGVEALWYQIHDLYDGPSSAETPAAAWGFLCNMVRGQSDRLRGQIRSFLFKAVQNSKADIGLRLELLAALTEGGRNLLFFEMEIGTFLLNWLPEIHSAGLCTEFYRILLNIIKFNASYVSGDFILGFVRHMSEGCGQEESRRSAMLDVLNALVCYTRPPLSSLKPLCVCLCRIINEQHHCSNAWQAMRHLLGTDLGHQTIQILCSFLVPEGSESEFGGKGIGVVMAAESPPPTLLAVDTGRARGAVYFLGMGLWGGTERVKSLAHKPDAVFPALIQALRSGEPLLVYEITVSLKRLVDTLKTTESTSSSQLPSTPQPHTPLSRTVSDNLNLSTSSAAGRPAVAARHSIGQVGLLQEISHTKGEIRMRRSTWSLLFQALKLLLEFVEANPVNKETANLFHAILTAIEEEDRKGRFAGPKEELLQLIDSCRGRETTSVIRFLLMSRCTLNPSHTGWISKVVSLMDRYFKHETRLEIRLKAIDILEETVMDNRFFHSDELIECCMLPFLDNLDAEPELEVRERGANLLVAITLAVNSRKCLDLLNTLEKVIKHACPATDDINRCGPSELRDVSAAITGLTKIFATKLSHLPSEIPIRAFRILVDHLRLHYKKPNLFGHVPEIRKTIFQCFLRVRADASYHLGYLEDDGTIRYSPYLLVEGHGQESDPPTPSSTPLTAACKTSTLSVTRGCIAVVVGLRNEKDWHVLSLLLRALPEVMQNKALTLSRHSDDVHFLAETLCAMVGENKCNVPGVKAIEVQTAVYPVLASIVTYHRCFKQELQQRLVRTLEQGLHVKTSVQTCISALTLCTLEMTETMHKLVPGVLLRLSKMSATVHTAVPVLEFLAMLCHLPSVYKSFVEQEYISILAITVPYTNPFKFSHFVVSLAHHVTAAWFLRTKVAFRQKSAVDFIRKGLKANVSKASLELNSRSSFGSQEAPYRHSQPAAPPNDSDMRQRSSSLHEKVHPRRALNHSATYTLLDFHTELTLTCYDFMARYAFASTVSCPKSSPMSTFLFENGTSESWLLGHQIVTITTSGCCLIPHRRGLCGPCWAHAADLQESRAGMEGAGRGDVSGLEDDPRRKRHQTDVRVAAGPELPLVPLGATGKEDSRNHIHSSMASVSVGDPQSVGSEEARCTCWCQGWAQVTIRRATGDTSFVIRLENDNIAEPRPSLQDLCSMFVSELPATDEELVAGPSEGSSERLTNEEACLDSVSSSPQRHESGSGTPVRRVNSSPNMEAVRRRTGELAARRKEEENADTSPPAEPMQIAGNASSPPSPNKRELHPIALESGATWQQQQRLDDSTPGSPTTSRQLRHLSAPQGQGILTPGAGGGSTGSLSRHSHGLNPRFLFLQFYYTGQHGGEDPIYLEKSSNLDRALKNLDLIPPYESHKIGVLYIPPGAKSCKDILCTKVTSTRYEQFLQGIGDVIDLTRTDKRSTFLGGLSTKGHDGRYAISWKDQVVQIIFHVATMMPTLPNDPNCNNKKAHIGNDKVVIVFNEGGTPYDLNTISGDCCLAAVDIQPLDHQSNLVNVRTRDAVGELLGHMEAKIASDESVPLLARLLAVHANMAGQVYHKSHGSVLFASNSLERLRQIRKLKAKSRLPPGSPRLSGEQEGGKAGNLEDFLSYV